jgi:hypothetical protein
MELCDELWGYFMQINKKLAIFWCVGMLVDSSEFYAGEVSVYASSRAERSLGTAKSSKSSGEVSIVKPNVGGLRSVRGVPHDALPVKGGFLVRSDELPPLDNSQPGIGFSPESLNAEGQRVGWVSTGISNFSPRKRLSLQNILEEGSGGADLDRTVSLVKKESSGIDLHGSTQSKVANKGTKEYEAALWRNALGGMSPVKNLGIIDKIFGTKGMQPAGYDAYLKAQAAGTLPKNPTIESLKSWFSKLWDSCKEFVAKDRGILTAAGRLSASFKIAVGLASQVAQENNIDQDVIEQTIEDSVGEDGISLPSLLDGDNGIDFSDVGKISSTRSVVPSAQKQLWNRLENDLFDSQALSEVDFDSYLAEDVPSKPLRPVSEDQVKSFNAKVDSSIDVLSSMVGKGKKSPEEFIQDLTIDDFDGELLEGTAFYDKLKDRFEVKKNELIQAQKAGLEYRKQQQPAVRFSAEDQVALITEIGLALMDEAKALNQSLKPVVSGKVLAPSVLPQLEKNTALLKSFLDIDAQAGDVHAEVSDTFLGNIIADARQLKATNPEGYAKYLESLKGSWGVSGNKTYRDAVSAIERGVDFSDLQMEEMMGVSGVSPQMIGQNLRSIKPGWIIDFKSSGWQRPPAPKEKKTPPPSPRGVADGNDSSL